MEKVIDIEERIPSLRERRKKRTNRKFFILLFVFLLLLGILIYSQTKYSKIQEISVEGANYYSADEYREASGLASGDSMWSFSEKDIEAKLSGLDWVESAAVEKKWLTGVDVRIKEFDKIGYLDKGTGYQMVLSTGHILDKPVTSINGPIFSQFEDPKTLKVLAAQLAETESGVYNMISQIFLNPEQEEALLVTLYMNDGNEVKATLNTLAEKLNYYPSIIAQLEDGQKGVIDMEVGIFFRSFADVYGPEKEGGEDEETEEES